MEQFAPVLTVPRHFWDREFGPGTSLPRPVSVSFEVDGQLAQNVPPQDCYVSLTEDSELRLSGLWSVCNDVFAGHVVVGWRRICEDELRLQLSSPRVDDTVGDSVDKKRRAPAHAAELQAKVPALGLSMLSAGRSPLGWDDREPQPEVSLPQLLGTMPPLPAVGSSAGVAMAWRGSGGGGRGRGAGRGRGQLRSSQTGRGCAKLVRTTTRLYIGVGQVREWLGEVNSRTELLVKVNLDSRLVAGVHQADLLYNRGAHYYWITSRTLKRAAMGKWFLGWSHSAAEGLVLLLRSPSRDEMAAAIAEGFQLKEEEEEEATDAGAGGGGGGGAPSGSPPGPSMRAAGGGGAGSERLGDQEAAALDRSDGLLLPAGTGRAGRAQATRSLAALAYGGGDGDLLMPPPAPVVGGLDLAAGGGVGSMGAGSAGGLLAQESPSLRRQAGSGWRSGPGPEEDEVVSGAMAHDGSEQRGGGRGGSNGPGGQVAHSGDPRLLLQQQRGALPTGSGGGGGPRRGTPALSTGSGADRERSHSQLRGDAGGLLDHHRDLEQLLGGAASTGSGGAGPSWLGQGPSYRGQQQSSRSGGSAGSEGRGGGGGSGSVLISGGTAARYTNFEEVPGGSAFGTAVLNLQADAGGQELLPGLQGGHGGGGGGPLPSVSQQIGGGLGPGRPPGGAGAGANAAGGAGVGPGGTLMSQAGPAASIASTPSHAAPTQLTAGSAGMLQNLASGVLGGPASSPLRLPANVSELLPPEYLPAAVSVRYTLDGSLQADVFGCEIHRTRQGHCHLFNLPSALLEGRLQQDWMISEDGCLVLCLKTAPPGQGLLQTQGTHPGTGLGEKGAGEAARGLPGPRGPNNPPSRTQPAAEAAAGRATELLPDASAALPPLGPGGGAAASAAAQRQQPESGAAAGAGTQGQGSGSGASGGDPGIVNATLPRKPDGKNPLFVARSTLESIYGPGPVQLPLPVIVRFQIGDELDPQVYLAEVVEAGAGQPQLLGTPADVLHGRILVGWGRMSIIGHKVLVPILEQREEPPQPAKAGVAATTGRPLSSDEASRLGATNGSGSGASGGSGASTQAPGGTPAASGALKSQPSHSVAAGFTAASGDMAKTRSPDTGVASMSGIPGGGGGGGGSTPAIRNLGQSPSAGGAAGGLLTGMPPPSAPPPLQPMLSGSMLPGVGSSKFPPTGSQALLNQGSNLLPAQASNLPLAGSSRPELAALNSRPSVALGARMSTPGLRAALSTPDLGGTGGGSPSGLLQTLASTSMPGPMHAPASRPPTAGGRPAGNTGWAHESGPAAGSGGGGLAAGLHAPSAFALSGPQLELAPSQQHPNQQLQQQQQQQDAGATAPSSRSGAPAASAAGNAAAPHRQEGQQPKTLAQFAAALGHVAMAARADGQTQPRLELDYSLGTAHRDGADNGGRSAGHGSARDGRGQARAQAQDAGQSNGAAMEEDMGARPPGARAVLRLLSAVEREPDT
ncbi:hypothetical protein CHLRE_13g571400v5 [Chlamydomonas reinhardtii]|uniref:Uncharacterized protein n=1 Tax=Chlamydomonas reinhardtii TaxID=3055 RepID=A0A2K3CZP0_CHLRE|nr:uncharacterized protein CHLRE_13g571400v5 [Chlamydomonas reinhardtii]PNW73752.1 hypothetical protein CHLRE_13g571400v5 [Chlamydomonas reinhardtii]